MVDDIYTELARKNADADAAFERDAVWPPGGFWERRETARALSSLPYLDGADPLAELPRDHAFREVVTAPARFASDQMGSLPLFAVARLHGAWTRGVSRLADGEDELAEFLLERVRAHGGDTRLGDRARSIVHKGGKVRGVVVDGDEAPTGVTFVVSDLPTARLMELAPDFEPTIDERAPVVEAAGSRFVLSMVVRPEGLPAPLAAESFLLPKTGREVHLQKADPAADGNVLLVAEALLDDDAPNLGKAREEILATVMELLPFVERHLVVCDSPNDGRPLWDFRQSNAQDAVTIGDKAWGVRARAVDRSRLRSTHGSVEPEAMLARFRVTNPALEGLGGEPIRTSLGNVFVTGKSVLPALGQEGELLAAWGVARVITRTDRRKRRCSAKCGARWSSREVVRVSPSYSSAAATTAPTRRPSSKRSIATGWHRTTACPRWSTR